MTPMSGSCGLTYVRKRMDRWKNDAMVVKLPTLLEGEALAVFTEIGEDERKDYQKVRDAVKRVFHPTEAQFSVLKQFEKRQLLPGESPRMFLHSLKRFLNAAMPELEVMSKEKLR